MKSQFLPADLFLKSSVVEKNPDMSFREAVAEFFGVEPEEITRIKRSNDPIGWDITIEGMYEPSSEEEDYQWDLGPEDWEEDSEESEWMSPKDMGIAQKIDWSDDEGNEISDDEKLAYFQSRDNMYEVDTENGLVRLRPEEDWFGDDEDDGREEWDKEGFNSKIAWENRWRDYRDPEDDSDEEEDRDPYSPWNMDY